MKIRKRTFGFVSIFICLFTFLCPSCGTPGGRRPDEKAATAFSGQPIYLDSLLAGFPSIKFSIVNDIVYGKGRVYEGVRSDSVFASIVKKYALDTAKYTVVFYCSDGYKPHMNLSDLLSDKGYFALKDISSDSGNMKKFEPIYLVWDMHVPGERYQSPYGISKMTFELKSEQNKVDSLLAGQPQLLDGYHKFRDNCQKCHSMNDEGGNVGPDLNYPTNVTEYWDLKQLALFIKNPPAFRHNSKMPVIETISGEDISRIIDYLVFMKSHKKQN